jgi:hypothetical protein
MNIKEFSQPTILKGTQYGTTVTIELDHSDTSIDEVMDGMLTIVKGLGYLDTTINEWIKEKGKDIYDDEHQLVKDALADDWFDEDNDEYNDFVDSNWDETLTDDRMNIIGQNGNEGLHYEDTNVNGIATDEDMEECELNDDESIIWFDEDEFQPNDKLKQSAKKYNDVVDMESGEVSYDEDGGFGARKLNKKIVKRGKIKDLKNGKTKD